MEPRISKPPEDPPIRKEMPAPTPTSTPPNTEASSMSEVTVNSGISVISQVVEPTERMLRIINLRPS
ncbi:hypothetical protein D3C80_1765360 [compost metagenome]